MVSEHRIWYSIKNTPTPLKDRWASACSVCGGRSRIVDDDERVGVGPFGFGVRVSPSRSPAARTSRAHQNPLDAGLGSCTCSTRAVLHDLDAAHSGRLRRGRCACPPPPLASRAHRGHWPHRRPLRICRARAFIYFADRLRAGAGRRSGSGWRQGRVRWGRPLLSRPRGAVGSGPAAVHAAVESAAVSAVAWSCGGLDGCPPDVFLPVTSSSRIHAWLFVASSFSSH